ncbi:hypothetical protein GGF31_003473 [Allomyces arbusculus]|nr:hypothetical protein GGF31_003473 [Allomyces arbusculus]
MSANNLVHVDALKKTLAEVANSPADLLDHTLRLAESFNAAALMALANGGLPTKGTKEHRMFRSLLAKVGSDSKHTVEYTYTAGKMFGRLNAKGAAIQHVSRRNRGYLCAGILQDLDMANCAPVILNQLVQHYGMSCPELEHLDKTMFLQGIFKKSPPASRYGGFRKLHKFLHEHLIPKLRREFPAVWDAASDEKNNKVGSFMSLVYQSIECKNVLQAYDFCKRHAIEPAVLMLDGLMVYKSAGLTPQILEELGEHTFAKTGFRVTWVEKPVTAEGPVPDTPPEKTPNEEIAEYIVRDFERHSYVKDDNHIYAPSDENRFNCKPPTNNVGNPMSVDDYIGQVLGDKFPHHLRRDACRVRRHVATSLSMYNDSIRRYQPNRSLIEANPEWFETTVCRSNTVAWTYLDNEFDFSIPRDQWCNLDFGPYRDVLDLQFGDKRNAMTQYVMLYFGCTMFPIGEDTVTKFTIAYLKDKVGWELTDVNADFFAKLGYQTSNNFVEGKGLLSSRKGAHMLPTSNYMLVLVEVYDELTKRFVFVHFEHKPEKENTFLQEQIRGKHLLNIVVYGLHAYHSTIKYLEENQTKTFRDDMLDEFFRANAVQAKLMNDPIGKLLIDPDCPLVVTKDPSHCLFFSDLLRQLDLQPKTKWNDSLMEKVGLSKVLQNICKHCHAKHLVGASTRYRAPPIDRK